MLGPNPRKAATPSTAHPPSTSSGSDSTGDGLMVKAIDDIFRFVESSENPQEFRVSFQDIFLFADNFIMKMYELVIFCLYPEACSSLGY